MRRSSACIVNERERFNAFDDGNLFGDDAVGHRVEHGVARAVGHVAGTPLLRAAEVALSDEPAASLRSVIVTFSPLMIT